MKKPLHIIYVTGVGDRNISGQHKVINQWRRLGVTAEICQMNWGDKQPWSSKFNKLLGLIDERHTEGKQIGLVGISAGASAVISAFEARRHAVIGVVCVCGKILHPETVGDNYRRTNPALTAAVESSQEALSRLDNSMRDRIMSRYALYDNVVSKKDSHIRGAHNRYVLGIIHAPTIALQITLGATNIVRFLKKQAKI